MADMNFEIIIFLDLLSIGEVIYADRYCYHLDRMHVKLGNK